MLAEGVRDPESEGDLVRMEVSVRDVEAVGGDRDRCVADEAVTVADKVHVAVQDLEGLPVTGLVGSDPVAEVVAVKERDTVGGDKVREGERETVRDTELLREWLPVEYVGVPETVVVSRNVCEGERDPDTVLVVVVERVKNGLHENVRERVRVKDSVAEGDGLMEGEIVGLALLALRL